uniref:Glutathione S-transferase family protein n=1 Tax=Zea mays TaxID=4577 RepID=A0A804Q1A1_MAIZE
MTARSALDEVTDTGAFGRSPSTFRSSVSRDRWFPAVAGRYHLYVSYACPWASRCLAFLKLKGLDHAIGVTVVKPIFERTKGSDEHLGWVFPAAADDEPDAEPNPLNGAQSVRELYEIARSNYAGKPTVPVLWDKQLKTVVNNESSEIIRMLNDEFDGITRNPGLDLYPAHLRASIDEANELVYDAINNDVYKCGFAKKKDDFVLVPDLGSLTSIHDRWARELFYYLKGGQVDYGEEHSKACSHNRFGRIYHTGHYPVCYEHNPVHFVGHSAGAQVVRVLQQMLADKTAPAYESHPPLRLTRRETSHNSHLPRDESRPRLPRRHPRRDSHP